MKKIYLLIVMIFSISLYPQENLIINNFNDDLTLLLEKGWEYAIGDILDFNKNSTYNLIWEKSDFPIKSKIQDKDKIVYLRNKFILSENAEKSDMYLWFKKLEGAMEVYVNDVLIEKFGKLPPDYFRSAYDDDLAIIPSGILKNNEPNIIMIKYSFSGQNLLFDQCYFVGKTKYETLKPLSYFLNITLYQMFTGILLFVTLFVIFLFIRNPKNYEYIFFGLGTFFFSIYLSQFYIENSIVDFLITSAIFHGAIFPALMCFIIFLSLFYKFTKRRLFYYLTTIFALFLYGGMFLQKDAQAQGNWFNISLSYLLYTLVVILVMSIKAKNKGNRYALPVVIGLLATIPAAIYDSVYSFLGKAPLTWFQGIALIFFILSMFYSIAKTLIDLYQDVENKSAQILINKENLEMLIKKSARVSDQLIVTGENLNENINTASIITNDLLGYNKKFDKTIIEEKKLIDNINKSISDISRSIIDLNMGIISQAELIESSSLSINKLSESIKSMKELSENAENISNDTYSVVKSGYDKVSKTEKAIKELEKDSSAIMTTMNIIEDISERTNILAMNAAIEAARAGKYGEGFGIIAKEVRNLASGTKKNSLDIRKYLQTILLRIKEFVKEYSVLITELEKIMDFTNKTKTIIDDINIAINEEDAATVNILESTKKLNDYKGEIVAISKNQTTMSSIIQKSCENLETANNVILDTLQSQNSSNVKFFDIIAKLKDISQKNLDMSNTLNEAIKEGM